jgi:hypothetical protein
MKKAQCDYFPPQPIPPQPIVNRSMEKVQLDYFPLPPQPSVNRRSSSLASASAIAVGKGVGVLLGGTLVAMMLFLSFALFLATGFGIPLAVGSIIAIAILSIGGVNEEAEKAKTKAQWEQHMKTLAQEIAKAKR